MFIPKKPKQSVAVKPPPKVPKTTKIPTPPPEPEEPEGVLGVDYDEYQLLSAARHGWKYDVMKLHTDKTVDVMQWQRPVKLNRKEPKRPDEGAESSSAAVPLVPLLGQDGKPVVGHDGNYVMIAPQGLDGRPYGNGGRPPLVLAPAKDGAKDKGKAPGGKGRPSFGKKKKTNQVFLQSEAARAIRKEEKVPWVLEDASGNETWVGRMEDAEKNETHALFIHAGGAFRFIPLNRWYKFQKRPTWRTLNADEAEIEYAKIQKNKDPGRWMMHSRNLATTLALMKAESDSKSGVIGGSATGSYMSGGRRLKTVDKGPSNLFGDDDEEGIKREKDHGAEGDFDEVEYEDDFADDEERLPQDGMNEEEEKELAERIKAEYRAANKQRDGHIDESDDEDQDDKSKLTGAGKDTKKLLKKIGGYQEDSDDDDDQKNPYASSADSEDEKEQEEAQVKAQEKEETEKLANDKRPAAINESEKLATAKLSVLPSKNPSARPSNANSRNPSAGPSRSGSPPVSTDKAAHAGSPASRPASPMPISRAASPGPLKGGSLPLGLGNSIVAQRATSPHRPKAASASTASRASSPLAGNVSRAESPNASTPRPAKRKAESGTSTPIPTDGTEPPAAKKPKKMSGTPKPSRPVSPPPEPFPGMLTEESVVEFLKKGPVSTKECITNFKSYMKDERNKKMLSVWIKKVGIMKEGKISLRKSSS